MDDREAKKNLLAAGTPAELSRQLGIDVHEVLAAISAASLAPKVNSEGEAVYEVEPVITAVVEQKRIFNVAHDPNVKNLIRDCVLSSAESIRHFIKEENKTAYQIKQMTESRFIDVLGQVGVSLGRLEAFMAQATRVMHQMDARLSSFERSQQGKDLASAPHKEHITTESSPAQAAVDDQQVGAQGPKLVPPVSPPASKLPIASVENFSNTQHWQMFETYLCQILSASGAMSDSARHQWLVDVRRLILMGSLEIRIEGDQLIAAITPALANHFSSVVSKLPKDHEVLPHFEDYYDWVKAHLNEGYPAILLYLIVLCNRGGQMSWFAFLSTFINEG